ncbi:unnamed protein product [Brassicogethes aeneus]|uniref:Uncharacterized protein n=1 Tax=Brassicogethes aeneus TaxID=1431903 RepID=A0A9P0ASD0_BRAAE|nr:unnamed protein product [Brassicogethes aeneus]
MRALHSITEAKLFWDKARIPTRRVDHCVTKLEKVYNDWRKIQKNACNRAEWQKTKENKFSETLDDLFDIAHADALSLIKIQEDKDFLNAQRKKGRQGIMAGLDLNLSNKEKRKTDCLQAEYSKHLENEISFQDESMVLASSESSDDSDSVLDHPLPSTSSMQVVQLTNPKNKRARVDFINNRIVSPLDRCKISDRNAVHLLIAVAEALGHDVSNLIINRSSKSWRYGYQEPETDSD